jgi:hypothetical protein
MLAPMGEKTFEMIKILLDKGILVLLVVWVSYFIARRLEKFKAKE